MCLGYVIISMGQNFYGIKILPMGVRGEKSKTFLQVKISGYTVPVVCIKLPLFVSFD